MYQEKLKLNKKYVSAPCSLRHALLKRGFTLIELLVVIAIIGILVAVVTSSFITAQKQTRDSRRKADLEQVRQALETYRSENSFYPTVLDDLEDEGFIANIPSDPGAYSYAYSRDTATTYRLCATLEIEPAVPGICTGMTCTGTCNYLTESP